MRRIIISIIHVNQIRKSTSNQLQTALVSYLLLLETCCSRSHLVNEPIAIFLAPISSAFAGGWCSETSLASAQRLLPQTLRSSTKFNEDFRTSHRKNRSTPTKSLLCCSRRYWFSASGERKRCPGTQNQSAKRERNNQRTTGGVCRENGVGRKQRGLSRARNGPGNVNGLMEQQRVRKEMADIDGLAEGV